MGRRAKLEKFAELLSFPNVYENYNPKDPKLYTLDKEIDIKGKWAKVHFKNNNKIILELACGKGDYALALAKQNPNTNYIGVDVKGNRIWRGAKTALEDKITNVAFLRTRIEQLDLFFGKHEIAEIWITFPDPFERKSKANRRLTAPNFLKIYKKILTPHGFIHLKTDADSLYEYTHESFAEHNMTQIIYDNDNIYSKSLDFPELDIKTFYEKQHIENGRTIKYIRFKLK